MVVTLRKILFTIVVLAINGLVFADGGSYGDIIKDTSEYKKITGQGDDESGNEREREDRRIDRDRHYRRGPGGGWIYIGRYPEADINRDTVIYENDDYYPRARVPGRHRFYIGLAIGSSFFDYDDIDDGDALLLSAGRRSRDERLGYELAYINTGNAEVTSLSEIELRVEALIFSLTFNSSKNLYSRWNAYATAGIYLADTALSGPVDEVDEDSNGFTFGVGFEYAVNRNFQLRLDARELIHVEDFANDESISLLSFGGKISF
jgi:hypothetical protein